MKNVIDSISIVLLGWGQILL